MEHKKNKNVDEHKRSYMYFTIGLAISISMALIAFEWKAYHITDNKDVELLETIFDDFVDIPPTVFEIPKPPVVQMPKIIEIIDEEEIDDIIDVFIDTEITDDLKIEAFLPEPIDDEEAQNEFIVLEKNAVFPGGRKAWGKFLNKHLRYPRMAKKMGIEGRVILQFDVSAKGEISNMEVIRRIGGGCDEEALRVLSKSPKWMPGEQRGRPVKSKHQMSIIFTLR